MEQFEAVLTSLSNLVWGPHLLILLIGTGIYLTFRLGFIQVTRLGVGLKEAFIPKQQTDAEVAKQKRQRGDISHFQALMTALAATVGTGNMVGVATAVVLGGPGAIVWMWLSGWRRNTPRRSLPSNIASSMSGARLPAGRCIIWSTA